ncbi:triacylglycerol lipase [Drepanopeziza brunnea f. sp. 'multigermtubi' MB_m1]|uniref:Triacylglycerol lipase n=1 Tax=Marssonina brunnea f. sp. multigermtubi (strain MB_m1) TaxID=1072389 RepID=K1WX49_MARBU|nr:triacylglycerol lipase [Drepanopeziza brunnea f. sp. 'multigermtubi' MB_m1]EKD17107.1 triacylglycerol lipase [Drepanopeziza brunnea f. sp. 'multigermtubi' MB_m1]
MAAFPYQPQTQCITSNDHRILTTAFLCKPMSFSTTCRIRRQISETAQDPEPQKKTDSDPRINDLGRAIEDDFATIRANYDTPKYPIVLAHGLLGFDELRLAGTLLPGVHYWRGITDAMRANGMEVITASVPPSGSIEERALKLGQDIAAKANGKSVNIIAHSMGGLDARYMISRLKPDNVKVLSLTTVATPHRGSSFADFVFQEIGPAYVPRVYKVVEKFGMGTGAFQQLTRKYMTEEFNLKTPDAPGVRYFSYGATLDPSLWSAFRQTHRIVENREGANDGLVSVESARWGTYKGTLVGVSHLDLINWTNRLRWVVWQVLGNERKFNAIAFYLDIADMLAKEGL